MNPFRFPVEIISIILGFLTPDSLISFSQTCRCFRFIVAPERFHFVQRLLVLELLPEFGGAIPILRFSGKSSIVPPLQDVESWDTIRYACADCLRIRHHRWFDNHSIFGLGLRKPRLISPAANALAEPGDASARWRRRNKRAKSSNNEERYWRRRYHEACNGGLADEEERSEMELCGKRRDRRLCIECHYSRGDYQRRTKSNVGSSGAPAIKTRVQYLRRWEPRIYAENGPNAPALVPCPAFTIRCSFCSIWQGLPEFRQLVTVYAGTNTATWHCNACARREYGANEQTKLMISYIQERNDREWKSLRSGLEFNHKRLAQCWKSLASHYMQLRGSRYTGQLAESRARYQQNISIMKTRRKQINKENRQMHAVWKSIAAKPEIEHELLLPTTELSGHLHYASPGI